eukprot:30040_6
MRILRTNSSGLPCAHGGSSTSSTRLPDFCRVPSDRRLALTKRSGMNSGISSLTSDSENCDALSQHSSTDVKSRSAWSNLPPCSCTCTDVSGSRRMRYVTAAADECVAWKG